MSLCHTPIGISHPPLLLQGQHGRSEGVDGDLAVVGGQAVLAIQLEDRSIAITGQVTAIVVVLAQVVYIVEFLIIHVELLHFHTIFPIPLHWQPTGSRDVAHLHETYPVVHPRSDDAVCFGLIYDSAHEGLMSSHFAVLVGVQVIEYDVIFVGHEDEVVLILPVEAAQVPQGNLQLNYALQHEMIVIQNYYLLLRCQADHYLLSVGQIDKRIHFLLKSHQRHLTLCVLQHSIVLASVAIIFALLDYFVGIVIHVVVLHIHALMPREKFVFLLLAQLTLQNQAVPHLPAVIEIRRKRIQPEAADRGLDVRRVSVLASRKIRGSLREEPLGLQASIEPLLDPAVPILVLYHHQLPRSVPQHKLRLADSDGGGTRLEDNAVDVDSGDDLARQDVAEHEGRGGQSRHVTLEGIDRQLACLRAVVRRHDEVMVMGGIGGRHDVVGVGGHTFLPDLGDDLQLGLLLLHILQIRWTWTWTIPSSARPCT